MPKPVYTTADEFAEGQRQLNGQINQVQASIKPSIDASIAIVQKAVEAVSDRVNQNQQGAQQGDAKCLDDAKEYADTCIENLDRKVASCLPPIETKIKDTDAAVRATLEEVNNQVRSDLATELMELAKKFEEELQAAKQETKELVEAARAEALGAVDALQKKLDAASDKIKEDAENQKKETEQGVKGDLGNLIAEQHRKDAQQDEKFDRATSEIWLKLERLQELIEENREYAHSHTLGVNDSLSESVGQLRKDAENRLNLLDKEATHVRNAVQEVEQISTRRVDWVIRNVAKVLRPPSASRQMLHRSYFSPKFNAAGAHGLQLELQIFKPSDPPTPGEECGDCAVYLWACKGMHLIYKLYIGTKWIQLEKVFNGRVPFGSKRLCFLRDQINKADNSIRISVEILEAIREIEHPILPPALEDNPENVIDGVELEKPLEGYMSFKRHMNNRLYDQVKEEVDNMRSRMVRKIEWKLEQASRLRRCFPPGEALCSVNFGAAGVEGMQLIFYPCGYTGATDGFCSLFLFGPAGATIKCALTLGDQKRDASNVFEVAGAFGRTNFCRFEAIIDEQEDTVLVGLEIDEAHQDLRAKVAHPVVVPGDRRTQGQIDGTGAGPVESVVKLKRQPGKNLPGFEDLRILPSLWIARMSADSAPSVPDGYKTFDDLKPVGGRRQNAAYPSPSRSESMPSFSPKETGSLERTGRPDASQDQLPRLARTDGNFADCGPNGAGRVRKPQRSRRSVNAMACTTGGLTHN